jgi:hypothetical protein
MSNSTGSYRSTTANHMKAYDNLPPSMRKVMANCNFDWATQPWLTYWKKGRYKTGPEMAVALKKLDADTTKMQLRKVWGADYPGALPVHSRRRVRQ